MTPLSHNAFFHSRKNNAALTSGTKHPNSVGNPYSGFSAKVVPVMH
ncbi:hypothetical protein SXCC_04493 [Gluconacetobacter sp. SXCC-1]|nr:hypothetical protein SXCC_04493 [Gluconacetobacter sp. SXCC-1]